MNIEKMRKELELSKVETSQKQMEFQVMEMTIKIEATKGEIENQKNRAKELRDLLANM